MDRSKLGASVANKVAHRDDVEQIDRYCSKLNDLSIELVTMANIDRAKSIGRNYLGSIDRILWFSTPINSNARLLKELGEFNGKIY